MQLVILWVWRQMCCSKTKQKLKQILLGMPKPLGLPNSVLWILTTVTECYLKNECVATSNLAVYQGQTLDFIPVCSLKEQKTIAPNFKLYGACQNFTTMRNNLQTQANVPVFCCPSRDSRWLLIILCLILCVELGVLGAYLHVPLIVVKKGKEA